MPKMNNAFFHFFQERNDRYAAYATNNKAMMRIKKMYLFRK